MNGHKMGLNTPPPVYTPSPTGSDVIQHEPYGISKKEHQVTNMPAAQNQKSEKSERTFLGKIAYVLTCPQKALKDIKDAASAMLKDLADYTVDSLASMAVMVKNVFRYTAYGAAGGLVAGAAISVYNPLMAPTIIPFSVGCGASAGAIYGAIKGSEKASDYFNELQLQRKQQEEMAAVAATRMDLQTSWI